MFESRVIARQIQAIVGGHELLLGNEALMRTRGVHLNGFVERAETLTRGGASPMYVAIAGRAAGVLGVADTLKPESRQAVHALKALGLDVWMLTGDARSVGEAIAREVGIEHVLAEVLPGQKAEKVRALQAEGKSVAMVGDGVNDVPALKEARLAIAQGSGAQMARSVADLVLVEDDFAAVPGMVGEGRQILRNIQRVARLFVTKTVFTAVVGLAVGIPTATFPLLPRQFTIASTVTIGIPAFLLALAPSSGPWRPERFLQSVFRFAIPAGVAIGVGIVAGYLLARYGFDLGLTRSRTVATGIVVVCGLAVVLRLEAERGPRRLAITGLCALMLALFALALVIPFLRQFYELSTPTSESVAAWAIGTTLGVAGMLGSLRLLRV